MHGQTNKKVMNVMKGHTSVVTSATFSPDGTKIAAGLWDKTIRMWDTATGSMLWTLEGHTSLVALVSFSPDSTKIASGSEDKITRV